MCGRMEGSVGWREPGSPHPLLLLGAARCGAAFPAWAAARPLPFPAAPAEGPCPCRGRRPGEGPNGNLMAGPPEIEKPLGKAAAPRAGKAEATSQLCPQWVSSQPGVLPRSGVAPGAGHPHLLRAMVAPHPPRSRPWETGGWGLAADADANADAGYSLPGCSAQVTLARQQPQLASRPGHTQVRARSQLAPQPRNLGSRCTRKLPPQQRSRWAAHSVLLISFKGP